MILILFASLPMFSLFKTPYSLKILGLKMLKSFIIVVCLLNIYHVTDTTLGTLHSRFALLLERAL